MKGTEMTTPTIEPDSSYSPGFRLWEAEMGFRVAARDVVIAARILCSTMGAYDAPAVTEAIVCAATARAETDRSVARALYGWNAAGQALMDAAWARAEVDSSFDVKPFLAR
jgi:N-formylglutamate amidohydrolase